MRWLVSEGVVSVEWGSSVIRSVSHGEGDSTMKIRLWCDSGANIHSKRDEVVDTVSQWGMEEGEWEKLTEEEKYELAQEWANDRLEIGFEEL